MHICAYDTYGTSSGFSFFFTKFFSSKNFRPFFFSWFRQLLFRRILWLFDWVRFCGRMRPPCLLISSSFLISNHCYSVFFFQMIFLLTRLFHPCNCTFATAGIVIFAARKRLQSVDIYFSRSHFNFFSTK